MKWSSLLSKFKIVGTRILIDGLYKLNLHASYFESLYVNNLGTKRTSIKKILLSKLFGTDGVRQTIFRMGPAQARNNDSGVSSTEPEHTARY